jgi:dihydrofolate reductase
LNMTILVAMTAARVIGRDKQLPWHIPEELDLFRRLTTGGTLIMGRRTFQAIGRPLPGRRNIVVSRTLPPTEGIEVCRNFPQALRLAAGDQEVFAIGGRQIFSEALPLADHLRISWLHQDYAGDVFFPHLDLDAWRVLTRDEDAEFTHVLYRRRFGKGIQVAGSASFFNLTMS